MISGRGAKKRNTYRKGYSNRKGLNCLQLESDNTVEPAAFRPMVIECGLVGRLGVNLETDESTTTPKAPIGNRLNERLTSIYLSCGLGPVWGLWI